MKNYRILITFIAFTVTACSKNLLEQKSAGELLIPHTAADMWMLLDNENIMGGTPGAGDLSGDEYYFTNAFYSTCSAIERNLYSWKKDIYEGAGAIYDWNTPYQQVFTCNVVLEALEKERSTIPPEEYGRLKANALFKRSWAFYHLSQLFAPAWDTTAPQPQPGIPLKLAADIEQPTVRATLAETYQQMIQDLQQTAALHSLSLTPDAYRNRPCQAAVYALLARIYLCMHRYQQAGWYADSSLQLYSALINYNTVSLTSGTPFKVDNAENLYTTKIPSTEYQCIQPFAGQANIDTTLYASYTTYDLRKSIFFSTLSGSPRRKNFYDGIAFTLYSGLATDEVYITLAECLARTHQREAALNYLNRLLITRYATGKFTPVQAASDTAAITLILAERRKELVMRGLRWTDLRRLASHTPGITPVRVINGDTLLLPPGSKNYTLPIPPDIIRLSGIPQNNRD